MSNNRAEWMKGGLGMMVHYLITPNGETDSELTADFNKTLDAFDIEDFMSQFLQTGAQWLIFTIGQNTGYYNSPNTYLDSVLPGHTSNRDLTLEIAQRVHAAGKRFIAYMPAEVMGQKEDVLDAFGWNPGDQSVFLDRYLMFVKAYSDKLGKLVDAWWFDGCYDGVHEGKWDWSRWMDAARSGNPDSAVALNDGAFCVGRLKPVSELQDYHAGEVHLLNEAKIVLDFVSEPDKITRDEDGSIKIDGKSPTYHMPESQFLHGVQWQALVPLDSTFNPGLPEDWCNYNEKDLIEFTKACTSVGGGVTYNVWINDAGHMVDGSIAKLRAVGRALGLV